jgi:hypothetical protein
MLALLLKRTGVPGLSTVPAAPAILAASPFGAAIAGIFDQSSVFPKTASVSTGMPGPEVPAFCPRPYPVLPASTECALDSRQEFVQFEGFLQETVDSLLEGPYGHISEIVPAHENDEGVGVAAADTIQYLRKTLIRENHVEENEIELVLGKQGLCLTAAESGAYFGVEDGQEHF